jgi:hypothetical protein
VFVHLTCSKAHQGASRIACGLFGVLIEDEAAEQMAPEQSRRVTDLASYARNTRFTVKWMRRIAPAGLITGNYHMRQDRPYTKLQSND